MFTGIIESIGNISEVTTDALSVTPALSFVEEGIQLGESIAVNGVCLTVVSLQDGALRFDVSPETFARTALQCLKSGSRVNLERAMKLGGRFGGHIVQGHVDTTGTLESRNTGGEFTVFRFSAPPEYDRYLVDKGSIAVDGISLTVVSPANGTFEVWIIPHTLSNTNLQDLQPGMAVNLEFDMLAKHVEKLLASQRNPAERFLADVV